MQKTQCTHIPPHSSAVSYQNSSQTRAVIVGVGKWGMNHLKVMQAEETVTEIRVLDPQLSSESIPANSAKKIYQVSSLQDCSQRSDLAIIATPAESHFQIAEFFLTRGVPTFVEKPLAPTRDECRELFRIAKRQNVFLGVGFQYRFHPGILCVQETVSNKADIAELSQYRSKRTKGVPREDVSVIMDLAIHDIALAVQLSKSELRGVKINSAQISSNSVIEACTFTLDFASGFTASIEVNWGGEKHRRMELETRDHHWTIDELNTPGVIIEQCQEQGTLRLTQYLEGTSLVRQKDWLLNKARSRVFCPDAAVFNDRVMVTADAVQRAATID
jgi:predicted dehydrogenase